MGKFMGFAAACLIAAGMTGCCTNKDKCCGGDKACTKACEPGCTKPCCAAKCCEGKGEACCAEGAQCCKDGKECCKSGTCCAKKM